MCTVSVERKCKKSFSQDDLGNQKGEKGEKIGRSSNQFRKIGAGDNIIKIDYLLPIKKDPAIFEKCACIQIRYFHKKSWI